jgi:hypothetical protein
MSNRVMKRLAIGAFALAAAVGVAQPFSVRKADNLEREAPISVRHPYFFVL